MIIPVYQMDFIWSVLIILNLPLIATILLQEALF